MHSCTIVMHSRTIVMHSRTIVKWNLCTDALIKLKWLRLDRGARIRPELFWKCTGSRETKPRKPNVYPVKKLPSQHSLFFNPLSLLGLVSSIVPSLNDSLGFLCENEGRTTATTKPTWLQANNLIKINYDWIILAFSVIPTRVVRVS